MYKLVTVDQMLAIEKQADTSGISYQQMMKNAGGGLADFVQSHFTPCEVLGLVGSGNNGGDTLIALTHLVKQNWPVKAYLARKRDKTDPLLEQLRDAGGEIVNFFEDNNFATLKKWSIQTDILLDGILGTGIKLPLTKEIREVLEVISNQEALPLVIAVDCPSGVDCRTGAASDTCIPADITVSMAAVKSGLLEFPAYDLAGQIHVIDIGLPEDMPALKEIDTSTIDAEDIAALIPERPTNAHKGTFGTVMLIAGSINYTGAVALSAKAAYRVGAGLVDAAIPGPLHSALAGSVPEATWLLLPHEMGVISESAVSVVRQHLSQASSLLIGPGLGNEDTTVEFVQRLLLDKTSKPARGAIGFIDSGAAANEHNEKLPPLVIDADGLNALARFENWHHKFPHEAILTPHPGEMSALTGKSTEEIQSNRLEITRKYAHTWNTIVILKGAFTVIAEPGGQAYVIPVATPALARAGTGDILSGMLAGLIAQGMPLIEAALAGTWIHAQAGLIAEDQVGHAASVIAGDVLEAIPDVLASL